MIEKDKIIQLENGDNLYILDVFDYMKEKYLELIKLNDSCDEILGESFGVKYISKDDNFSISVMSNLDFYNIKK